MTNKASSTPATGSPMTRIMSAMMLSCREISRLSSQAMDSELSHIKRMRLRLHLMMCKWCRRNEKQLRMMRRAVRFSVDDASGLDQSTQPGLTPEARKRLEQHISDHR